MNTGKLKLSENPFNIAKNQEFELIKGMSTNKFCHAQRILSIKQPPSPHPSCQVLKVRLIKICKIQPPDLLFLFLFISIYVSSYHFSKTFRTSFNNIRKKHELFFFNGFAQIPPPRVKSTKCDKSFLSMVPISHDFKNLISAKPAWNTYI